MTRHQGKTRELGRAQAPRGRTRWGVVAAILGVPAPAVAGFLGLMAAWVLFGNG